MKVPWPSCLPSCFGPRPATPECDASHSSIGKCHGTSSTVRGGILSFLSGISGSKGTWEYTSSDGPKTRISGARARVDADVVTLATARYLELFTSSSKYHDEPSAVFSDLRRGHDSIRSVQTVSDRHGSRSSFYNGASRGSREAPRQVHNPCHQQPGSPRAHAPCTTRQSASSSRGANTQPEAVVPPPRTTSIELTQSKLHGRPLQDAPHAPAALGSLNPFLARTRALADTGRSRSDRISPSAAACLLPAPSRRHISRAHTALAASSGHSSALSASMSMGELCGAAEKSVASSTSTNAAAGAVAGVPKSPLRRSSTSCCNLADGYAASRPSRLHTESGGDMAACSSLERGNRAAGVTSQAPRPRRSLASGPCGAATRGYRRPSIVFSQDGDITVTGLPPSCLSAGRSPRSRRDSSACGSGHVHAANVAGALDVSSPLRASAGHCGGFGSYTRRSVDGSGRDPGASPSCGPGPIPPAFLLSHSNDSRVNNTDGGRCADSMNLIVTLNPLHSAGLFTESSILRSTEAMHAALVVRGSQSRHSAENLAEEGAAEETSGGGHVTKQLHRVLERPDLRHQQRDARAQALAAVDSSSEGQRCDWGGSSRSGPYRFSNSSHLTHGNTSGPATVLTGNTAYMLSNNPLEALGQACSPLRAAQKAAVQSEDVNAAKRPLEQHVGLNNAQEPATGSATAREADNGPAAEGPNPATDTLSPLKGERLNGGCTDLMDGSFGCQGSGPGGGHQCSLLAEEARDVTSALSRLQEACMAAVAQGDMRSQRLSRRLTTHLPTLQMRTPGQALGQGARAGHAANMRPNSIGTGPAAGRIMGAFGDSIGDPRGVAGFAGGQAGSTTLVRVGGLNAHMALYGPTGGVRTGPAAHVPPALSCCPEVPCSEEAPPASSAWEDRVCDEHDDRASVNHGIVMDGQMLDRLNCTGEESFAVEDFGGVRRELSGPEAEAEAYRTRMLDVLLCGDFLHDTQELASLPCSDDDDDVDVEYRYGGFELGGEEVDTSYRRQASFVEAVRKCSAQARVVGGALVNTAGSETAAHGARAGHAAASPAYRGAPR
ncbi:hypothetical protein Agub_g2214 [Astrephomene gubernaculifera]|uniref:Uncharacterized protein n=1 Tax=Astrephomene gubernaculifera TaxID=47775 RepID=A0AAD3DH91_9CHLO|nr:hypothetical protein Agub_g2214 [Astrephomene gubernaculifera]